MDAQVTPQTMTKKVEGYMINQGGWIEFDQAPDDNGPWVPCTMVVHGGQPERNLETHAKGGHYSYEETVTQWVPRARAIVRKKHGFSDPS